MVTKLHILLTYNCSLRCKHCYVYSSQRAAGKISLSQISYILNAGRKLPGIEWIIFGGGEPFTQYPLLLKTIHRARQSGFEVGVETNGYFARTVETGIRFLRPLAEMGVKEVRISNDYLHYKNPSNSPAKRAIKAAAELGLITTLVQVKLPEQNISLDVGENYATEIIERRFSFAGRAAESFTQNHPLFDWRTFKICPRDDLRHPDEVFIDAYGYVQICPGIAIGNIWKISMDEIFQSYDPETHKVLGPMLNGGPAELIKANNLTPNSRYIEACHCCYSSRQELLDQYPEHLGPRHVYGL